MNLRNRSMAALAGLLGASGAIAPAAHAQDPGNAGTIAISPNFSRSDVAGMRTEPDLMPQPLTIGSFRLDTSLTSIAAYETNVQRRANGVGDASLTITPQIALSNSVDNFGIDLGAVGVFRRYLSRTRENLETGTLNGRIRTRVGDASSFALTASYGREAEPRGVTATLEQAAEPVFFTALNTGIEAEFALGSLRVSPSASYSERTYSELLLDDGTELDQTFRDQRAYGGALSLGYAFSPLVVTFVSASIEETESTNPAPNAARDSQRRTLTAGIRGELSPLVIAQLSAGYRETDFELERFEDVSGFTFNGDVQWFATPLLSFRFNASQSPLNAGRPDVSSILSSRIAASAYYDPLRNLRLSSTLSYTHNDYRDTDTVAHRSGGRLQAQYFLSPRLSFGGYVDLIRQDVSGSLIVDASTSFITGLGFVLTP